MLCLYCGSVMTGRKRKYCTRRCVDAAYYQRKKDCRTAVPLAPVVHHGRFQDYQNRYAGMLDVIITDLPYAKKFLPLYADLADFARTTLAPGGWMLCLTGWGIDVPVRLAFEARGLEFKTVCCYHMPSARSNAVKHSTTGRHVWQEHHKPLLWYQQPGSKWHRRRAGTSDLIEAQVTARTDDLQQDVREWEQSRSAFEEIVRLFTNPQDVLCDPCMGWGTTLAAAVSLERRRCIGIEILRERYTYACQQLGL